jgi:hypothetical protein
VALVFLAETIVYADAKAFEECAVKRLLEILEIATITAVISIIVEKGLEEVGKYLATEAAKALLAKLIKALAKRLIPWLGVIAIIIELALLLKECIPLLFK